MKKIAKLVSVLLLAVLMASLCASAWAVDTTTYKVRIYAGNQGTLNGGNTVVEATYNYNDPVSLPSVAVKDNRYYVKGFREAGKDNSTYNTTSFTVKRDIDYVVAYGMKSTAVEYTVNYVTEEGETLFPSQTYFGNAGDKPVVAFRYIEGYQPQAYNLTKTLTSNPADNVFTFTYLPIEAEVTTTTIPAGNPAGIPVVNPAGNVPGGAGANAGNAGAAPAQPEEIIDLDVPLAAPDDASTGQGTTGQGTDAKPGKEPEAPKDTKLASWIPYVLGLGGVALLAAFLTALLKRKKPGVELTREDLEGALEDAKKEVDESDKK